MHLGNAAKHPLQLGAFPGQHEDFLLGTTLKTALRLHCLQFLHAVQTLRHGLEVGEHTAQPPVVHIRHANTLSLFLDGFLGLLLGANIQNGAAVGDGFLDELESLINVGEGLLQVNDVDAVAFSEDEAAHLRVPTAGLMAEVHTRVQKLAHGNDCHDDASFL